MRVFAERGYEKATVAAVVKEAGLSKGTFYWVFDSKEHLFSALIEERIERPIEALMAMVRAAPHQIETSAEVSTAMFTMLAGERELMLLAHEYWAAAVRDEGLKDRYRERLLSLRETIAMTLGRGHDIEGVPATMPMEDLAMAMIALVEGLALQRMAFPDLVDERLFGEIGELIWDGFLYRAQRDADA
jgi:AcrR family transcriptional regulator